MSKSARALRRARTRASKFYFALNELILCALHVSGHFKHFEILRARTYARAFCAYAHPIMHENAVFSYVMDSLYLTWQFQSIFNSLWHFIRSYERVKVENPRARQWAFVYKILQKHGIFQLDITLQNAQQFPIFISYWERVWCVDMI